MGTTDTVILITNPVDFHDEVIESVIVKYPEIIKQQPTCPRIYLHRPKNRRGDDFEQYISEKYPKIIFGIPSQYDYCINVSVYPNGRYLIKPPDGVHYYISHEYDFKTPQPENIFYLSPAPNHNHFSADIFPFADEKTTSSVPIYAIQGNLNHNRRNLDLLLKILSHQHPYDYKIKMIGKGTLPQLLNPYRDNIILKNNLSFMKFHKEFLDCYCILPLVLKKSHPQYYQKKITSSINYAKGYHLKCLIDEDLQSVYKLQNVEIFSDETNIVEAFDRTLAEFYSK